MDNKLAIEVNRKKSKIEAKRLKRINLDAE